MTNCIGIVYAKIETEILGPIESGYVTKTRQDNDMTDHTDTVYTKNETELS